MRRRAGWPRCARKGSSQVWSALSQSTDPFMAGSPARSPQPENRPETTPFRQTYQGSGSCLVAERYWDAVAWAIEEYAWRFEALMSPPDAPTENTGGL